MFLEFGENDFELLILNVGGLLVRYEFFIQIVEIFVYIVLGKENEFFLG